MFKLIVLSVLVAVVAAKPGLLHAPLVAAPAVTSIVQPPPLLVKSTAHVGSVVSHVPTSISSQSSSVVHSTGAVVTPVVTPVHKTVIAAPIVKTYAAPLAYAPAPLAYAAPLSYGHAAPLSYGHAAPLSYGHAAPLSYGHAAPLSYGHSAYSHAPLAYSASYW